MTFNTRIAPSPTGPLHLGTVRTLYFNWLAARASGGRFYLRIDDTDKDRSDIKWVNQIFDTMLWLGLDWDGTHIQSERMDIYQACADSLIDRGHAKRDGLRVHLDLGVLVFPPKWTDEIAGDVPISLSNLTGAEKMTLIKSDGMPTYHFASCVDDIDLGINFVIRGVDHTTNTAKHVLLYRLLGGQLPKYAHIGLLRHKKKKLSKRDAEASFQHYTDKGYDPDAVLNFLARCGWGPTVDDKSKKILTRDDMVKLFLTDGKMKNSDCNLDFALLDSYDRKYKGRKASALKQEAEKNERQT
jgi:glutamyl-tRNA synthetase